MLTIRHLQQNPQTDPSYHIVENSKFILRIRSEENDQIPSVELHVKGKAGIIYELCNAFQRSHMYYSNSSRIEDHMENNFRTPQVQVRLNDLALVSNINEIRKGNITLALQGVKNHGRKGDIELRIKADESYTNDRGIDSVRIHSLALLMTPVLIPGALLMKIVPVHQNMTFIRISHYFLIIRTQSTSHQYQSIVLFDDLSKPKMIYRLFKVWESYAKDNTVTIPSFPVNVLDELSLITQANHIRQGSAKCTFLSAIKHFESHHLEMHIRLEMELETYGLRMLFDPVPTYVNDK